MECLEARKNPTYRPSEDHGRSPRVRNRSSPLPVPPLRRLPLPLALPLLLPSVVVVVSPPAACVACVHSFRRSSPPGIGNGDLGDLRRARHERTAHSNPKPGRSARQSPAASERADWHASSVRTRQRRRAFQLPPPSRLTPSASATATSAAGALSLPRGNLTES